jgi:hypothetical protein
MSHPFAQVSIAHRELVRVRAQINGTPQFHEHPFLVGIADLEDADRMLSSRIRSNGSEYGSRPSYSQHVEHEQSWDEQSKK